MHSRPRIFQFLSAVKADLVRPLFYGEHPAQLDVMAPEGELKHP
jgi:hypothetical protein